ncbi:uncharacterized protein TNCV_1334311 [Trichonephila clavipes]|nr:uncharacterized protein TNCV_1334311 [Trichonephila clavipes]
MIMKFEETGNFWVCCPEEDRTRLGLKLWKNSLLRLLCYSSSIYSSASGRSVSRELEIPWSTVIAALEERQCLQTTIFMLDGATPHFGRQVKTLLSANFGDNRVISRIFSDAWSSLSPDFNPCDFCLWRFLKDCV